LSCLNKQTNKQTTEFVQVALCLKVGQLPAIPRGGLN
jgi:hypothetical protein